MCVMYYYDVLCKSQNLGIIFDCFLCICLENLDLCFEIQPPSIPLLSFVLVLVLNIVVMCQTKETVQQRYVILTGALGSSSTQFVLNSFPILVLSCTSSRGTAVVSALPVCVCVLCRPPFFVSDYFDNFRRHAAVHRFYL